MSADGTALPSFVDFVLATKPHKITPSDEILNDAARRTYLLAKMLKGRGVDEVVQAGQSIIDQIQLAKMNNAGFYRPNQNLQPRGVDTLTQITCPWRFHQGNYGWTEEQVDLNLANGGDAADIYTRLKNSWDQACTLDIWDTMENALYATPDPVNMELSAGLTPYSIPCFITDDGFAPQQFQQNGTLTVMTVNPATQAQWRNQVETFTAADPTGTLYKCFDRMWRKLQWKKMKGLNKEAGSPATDSSKLVILTNLEGDTLYSNMNRDANDRLRKPNDAGQGDSSTFNGVDIDYIENLDSVFTPGLPKFDWVNTDFLFPVYHKEKYMTEVGPIRGAVNQPFSWAIFKKTYYNLFCRSRRRQGRCRAV